VVSVFAWLVSILASRCSIICSIVYYDGIASYWGLQFNHFWHQWSAVWVWLQMVLHY
jgi:hypothetical protein